MPNPYPVSQFVMPDPIRQLFEKAQRARHFTNRHAGHRSGILWKKHNNHIGLLDAELFLPLCAYAFKQTDIAEVLKNFP